MITIFSIDHPKSTGRPSAFVVSLLLHCAIVCVVVLGLQYSHDFPRPRPRHYAVQLIHLQAFERADSRTPAESIYAPSGPQARMAAKRPFQLPRPKHVRTAKQTLVRLDVPPDLVLPREIPVPSVFLWTPNTLPSPPRWITPPKTVEAPAQSLPARPSFTAPNSESRPAEITMAQTAVRQTPALPVPPSAAPPVRINGPEQGTQLPQTTSADSQQATPAHVLSIAELPLRAESMIVMPAVTQFGPEETETGNGDANAGSKEGSTAKTPSENSTESRPDAVAVQPADSSGSAASRGNSQPSASAQTSEVTREQQEVTRIELPKDGRFGAVVLGSSASGSYPETEGVLSGRVVYTVYLRVGLHKNWILQYCLPKNSDPAGSAIEAPWPFVLVRPNQLASSAYDYVIVHGLINPAGHFEQLAVVYPTELPEREVLLGALRHWAFRPASRDGQALAVEALLVIPQEGE